MDQHALTVQQFGSTAARYLASPVHSSGTDLDRLAGLARESRPSSALDLGCGAGHASYALARTNSAGSPLMTKAASNAGSPTMMSCPRNSFAQKPFF